MRYIVVSHMYRDAICIHGTHCLEDQCVRIQQQPQQLSHETETYVEQILDTTEHRKRDIRVQQDADETHNLFEAVVYGMVAF